MGIHPRLREAVKESDMEYIAAGMVDLGLAAYLFYALLRPERF